MALALWHAEFDLHRDHLVVRKTGAVVPYSLSILKEALDWYLFFLGVQALRLVNGLRGRRGLKLAFAPSRPRPWYLLWAVSKTAGARYVEAGGAQAVIYFDDTTTGAPPDVSRSSARRINFECVDVSKSRVAEVFEAVFNYPLAVDPETWSGLAVEKSELNGAHDGAVVECPRRRKPGFAYQRLVRNTDDGEIAEDLRCPTVDGEIPLVFIKRRPVSRRFANMNSDARLVSPESVLSDGERAKLREFAQAMKLDWGGLDVLRDRRDGRIYVVDVNKTDMGPPTALSFPDQFRAAKRLARAFDAAFSPTRENHGL